ncbi:cell wall alpha-amylase-like protein Aah3 [Schizosaccharomyces osmophilus]|uniref:alpha-amylase n=1 Tax=Schizosaccharomyces osmophilus TaxID=2545709 RepID=A0AAE9WEH7_9SCHI|nr:cell wall alpha-amylase-like protein Aah3 [Schizosaccharomyces osmophilus]WBW74775.1 cell wall alpha-amylase-like protein Aah3 [Schizosaccharomyces osmophilus]
MFNLSSLLISFFLVTLFGYTSAHSADEWRTRIIYQIVTDRFAKDDGSTDQPCNPASNSYCGGTWKGIEKKLNYIEDLGFTAIWISPVDENIEGDPDNAGEAYHGYWNTNYEKLNKHFGTEDDLVNLINAAHKAGIWVMLDTVVNSMALVGPYDQIDYSKVSPFNGPQYFHPYCIIDWNKNNRTNIQDCWQNSGVLLADLNVESSSVKSYLNKHIKQAVNHLGYDGLRIDAVKMMNETFFPEFVDSAGVFAIGEVFDYDPNVMCDYMNYHLGVTNYVVRLGFNFSFMAHDQFAPTAGFKTLQDQMKLVTTGNCSKADLGGMLIFLDNHDLPRYASYTDDQAIILSAYSFALLWDGIPSVYYGQEQGFYGGTDPANREALWSSGYDQTNPYYTMIKTIVNFRKHVMEQDTKFTHDTYDIVDVDVNHVAAKKRDVFLLYNNLGIKDNGTVYKVPTQYNENEVVSDVFGHRTLTVGHGGNITATLTHGYPMVLYPHTKLSDFTMPTINQTVMPSTAREKTTTVYTSFYSPTYSTRSFAGSHSLITMSSSHRAIPSFETLFFAFVFTTLAFIFFC